MPFIIGTAGHIDHGKTALIRALTGMETDRLKEEKERGISIDLGFAYFDLPNGQRAGIVDVPGHERFIKNMLAGATGIDLVIFVVAADDGVMPQTKEHLDVLHLLGVRAGIVTITKVDMVKDDRVDEVIEEVRGLLKGTTLEGAPIYKVSSIKGLGIEELKKAIISDVLSCESRPKGPFFRLPVDRVFTMKGFGTVVTGTVLSGEVERGWEVNIFPEGYKATVRGLESHFERVGKVSAGQRAALNLSGIDHQRLKRGDMVVSPELTHGWFYIDVSMEIIQGVKRPIKDGGKVKFFHATKEVDGVVIPLDSKEASSGYRGYSHLRLKEPLMVMRGDRFILRDFASPRVIGGGEIILPHPKPLRKRELKRFPSEPSLLLKQLLLQGREPFFSIKELRLRLNLEKGPTLLKEDSLIIAGDGDHIIHRERLEGVKARVLKTLEDFHRKKPSERGIEGEVYRKALNLSPYLFRWLMDGLQKDDMVKRAGPLYSLSTHSVQFSEKEERIREVIIKNINERGIEPVREVSILEAMSRFGKKGKEVWHALIRLEEVVRVSEDYYTSRTNIEKALEILKKGVEGHGKIKASQYRDLLGTGRKTAILFLEYFDKIKVTLREGDYRILRKEL